MVACGLAAACLICSGAAQALTPTEPEKAEIVYSNGGRILSIKADGSDRRVLTRPGKVVRSFFDRQWGDRLPKLSPDGTRMIFVRKTVDSPSVPFFFADDRNMLANADGTGARQILKPSGKVSYDEVSWMPDGSIVAAKRLTRGPNLGFRTERSVVTMNLDGSNQRTVFRLGDHLQGSLQQDLSTYFLPIELAPSPDGQNLLVTIQNGYRDDGRRLELVSMVDGTRTQIARKSYSGGWSPDGVSIVFGSDRAQNGKVCATDGDCRAAGDIFIADADGSGQKALVSGRADEADPAWSPDGRAIAFSSNRIRPREEYGAEIYSVRPDGSCLTWLTNGSPASITPGWGPSGVSDPGVCGATGRPALVEGSPPRTKRWQGPRLWLGPEVNGALYSEGFAFLGISINRYGDCGDFALAACPAPVVVSSISNCLVKERFAAFMAAARKHKSGLTMRGVRVLRGKDDDGPVTLVFSGGAMVAPGVDLFADSGVSSGTFAEQRDLVRQLRIAGAGDANADLPPMLTPKFALRKARKVARTVKRSGSVQGAAKRLRMKPRSVRFNLALRRNARSFGPIRPMSCPSQSGLGAAFASSVPGSTGFGKGSLEASARGLEIVRRLSR